MSTPEGRARLALHGLNPYLVRLSCGLEPLEHILGALAEALGVKEAVAAAASAAAGLPQPSLVQTSAAAPQAV